ncbi:MAG TPA: family 43 glycosylhydrolase [Pyrinomonadaceae bacterium]|nr:family 43 glycosylhydrolase [Pyrinomonadaceae bacterium]
MKRVENLRRTLRAGCVAALLVVACWLPDASAQEQQRPSAQPEQTSAAATYSNPVIAGDYPDPSVIRFGDEFWATTTSGGWAPHFPLLRSRDLVNWEVAGAVLAVKPEWAERDFWAPEITEDKGRIFVYYTARKRGGPLCVAVAGAAQPLGPYTDHGPLVCQEVGSIDAFVTRDEQGKLFLIWKEDGNSRNLPTVIWAQQLSEEGTKLVGKRKEILRNRAPWERHVVEGSYIMRRGDWFYHFYSGNACCGRSCNYALGVARSRKLLGPWERNPANPILKANESWQCPGHGSIVRARDGRTFLLYHAYRQRADAMNIGRESLLDEVRWNADGWPSINEGRGPSSNAPAPEGVAERPAPTEFFDGFNSPQLAAGWQWPMSNQQTARVEVAPAGHLLLTCAATATRADDAACAVVARPSISGSYTATTAIDLRQLTGAARAGLSAYGWADAAVGITVGGGKVFVWRREDERRETVAVADAPNSPAVFLRLTATEGQRYRFAYSANGRDWKELGAGVEGSYIEGARVALHAGGASGATARFDWIKISTTNAEQQQQQQQQRRAGAERRRRGEQAATLSRRIGALLLSDAVAFWEETR